MAQLPFPIPYSRTSFSLSFLLFLTGIPCLAGSVETDFDYTADFARYKSFSFIGQQELTRTGLLSDHTIVERLKNFIAGAIEPRGLHEVPADQNYGLAVRFWVSRKQKTEETVTLAPDPFFAGYPAYWTGAWAWSYEEYVIHNYVEGSLVIDLIDPFTKDLVWRTFLRQKIEDREKAYEEAKKNLHKSFALYPPSLEEKEKMRKQREKWARKYGAL
jgi:hypothetical protein